MPKVAPQLSRFKGKEVQRRRTQEQQGPSENKKKKATFVQSGKSVEFGPGLEKALREKQQRKWKHNKSRTPRSPYMTHRGAKNLDARKEAMLGKTESGNSIQSKSLPEVVVPVIPVQHQQPKRSMLSKLAEIAGSSLDLVTSGFTDKFLKKRDVRR